ncbi:MAG: hypothetical protein HC836_34360 [Richelia sp. RM2_1_2]|nr:hypothetical protein [Richelia sp. RM2_1_2]
MSLSCHRHVIEKVVGFQPRLRFSLPFVAHISNVNQKQINSNAFDITILYQ